MRNGNPRDETILLALIQSSHLVFLFCLSFSSLSRNERVLAPNTDHPSSQLQLSCVDVSYHPTNEFPGFLCLLQNMRFSQISLFSNFTIRDHSNVATFESNENILINSLSVFGNSVFVGTYFPNNDILEVHSGNISEVALNVSGSSAPFVSFEVVDSDIFLLGLSDGNVRIMSAKQSGVEVDENVGIYDEDESSVSSLCAVGGLVFILSHELRSVVVAKLETGKNSDSVNNLIFVSRHEVNVVGISKLICIPVDENDELNDRIRIILIRTTYKRTYLYPHEFVFSSSKPWDSISRVIITVSVVSGIICFIFHFVVIVLFIYILMKTQCVNCPKDSQRKKPYRSVFSKPKGIVILFTDIAKSSVLWNHAPRDMAKSMVLHDSVIREGIRKFHGEEVKLIGDSFMVAFKNPRNAINFALDLQETFPKMDWPKGIMNFDCCGVERSPISGEILTRGMKIRIGIHYCREYQVVLDKDKRTDYIGLDVSISSRIEGQCIPGRILVSEEFMNHLEGVCGMNAVDAEIQQVTGVALKGMGNKPRTLYCIGQKGRSFSINAHFNKRRESVVSALHRFLKNPEHDLMKAVKNVTPDPESREVSRPTSPTSWRSIDPNNSRPKKLGRISSLKVEESLSEYVMKRN